MSENTVTPGPAPVQTPQEQDAAYLAATLQQNTQRVREHEAAVLEVAAATVSEILKQHQGAR